LERDSLVVLWGGFIRESEQNGGWQKGVWSWEGTGKIES